MKPFPESLCAGRSMRERGDYSLTGGHINRDTKQLGEEKGGSLSEPKKREASKKKNGEKGA